MFELMTGQELEFIEPVEVEGRTLAKGTRVRVGAILSELLEPDVMLVVLNSGPPVTLTVEKHVVMLHCRPVR